MVRRCSAERNSGPAGAQVGPHAPRPRQAALAPTARPPTDWAEMPAAYRAGRDPIDASRRARRPAYVAAISSRGGQAGVPLDSGLTRPVPAVSHGRPGGRSPSPSGRDKDFRGSAAGAWRGGARKHASHCAVTVGSARAGGAPRRTGALSSNPGGRAGAVAIVWQYRYEPAGPRAPPKTIRVVGRISRAQPVNK
jgi:hypothetical protein